MVVGRMQLLLGLSDGGPVLLVGRRLTPVPCHVGLSLERHTTRHVGSIRETGRGCRKPKLTVSL